MDPTAYALPETVAEFMAAVPCTKTRVVMASKRSYLPKEFAARRRADWRALLASGLTQTNLAQLTGLSRARTSQLTTKAWRECLHDARK